MKHDLFRKPEPTFRDHALGLPIVGKLLGHANATTTARYAHLDADPLRVASERIAGTIAAAMGEEDHRRPGTLAKLRG